MYYGMTLFLAAVLLWQLISGQALGSWGLARLARPENPRGYWLVLTVQVAIFIAFVATGRTWHVR
jgi:hypothetical protein